MNYDRRACLLLCVLVDDDQRSLSAILLLALPLSMYNKEMRKKREEDRSGRPREQTGEVRSERTESRVSPFSSERLSSLLRRSAALFTTSSRLSASRPLNRQAPTKGRDIHQTSLTVWRLTECAIKWVHCPDLVKRDACFTRSLSCLIALKVLFL